MKIVTTGNLYKIFKENDEDTIIRMRNLRTLVRNNNFNYHKVGENYLIDYDDFMKKINPKNLEHRYNIPKLRSIKSATREYNKTHKNQISYHLVERCIATGNVSYVKTIRLYLINYEELEREIENQIFRKRVTDL